MVTFSLEELTEQAGVTVRTVRYYIAEGLLPPPVGGGPRSAYTEGHLDRLLLINRLKDAYLPLREIRRRLAGLDDEAVRAALAQAETPARPAGAAESMDSAADYIARVLQAQATGEPPPRRDHADLRAQARTGFTSSHRVEEPPPLPVGFAEGVASESAPDRSTQLTPEEVATWRRLPITDGAELLVREDAYQRRAEQIESLIAWAKRILG
jgi:DNA-binding transcriptional MerR regulator